MTNEKYTAETIDEEDLALSPDFNFTITVNDENVSTNIYGGGSFSFGKNLAGISRDNGVMTFSATDGTNLTVETQDTPDQAVNIDLGGQRYTAKIGDTNKENSLTYANNVNYYMGGSFYDKINIFSGYGETASINLNTQTSSILIVEIINYTQ